MNALRKRRRALVHERAAARANGYAQSGRPHSLPSAVPEGVSIHSDTLLSPLHLISSSPQEGVKYEGGLLDRKSGELVSQAIHYNGMTDCQVSSTVDELVESISSPCLYAGLAYSHFGHFMAESLGRLWAYPAMRDSDPCIVFLIPQRMPSVRRSDDFVFEVLRGFSIPFDRVLFVDRPLHVKSIAVPIQRYGFGYLHAPDKEFVDFIREYSFRRRFPKGFKGKRLIYVSRSSFSGRGLLVGEKKFETYLTDQGYTVFHPETATLPEQLTLYESADRIVFAEGSAVFACVLLPDLQAKVAIIARRRDPTLDCQTLVDCLSGYGRPPLWIDHVRRQYQLGLPSWDALTDVDWVSVSEDLSVNGFVSSLPQPHELVGDEQALAEEVVGFLARVRRDPAVAAYVSRLTEPVSTWDPGPHLVDPRTGEAVRGDTVWRGGGV